MKINELKNKISIELKKIRKMNSKELQDYILNLLIVDKKQVKKKKEEIVFNHQIQDPTPEVIELINRFKMDLGLDPEDSTGVNLEKKDEYTIFIEYIEENNIGGKLPPAIQTQSDLGIKKDKRQELLKRALEEDIVYKVNSTTYGLTKYREG